MLLCDKICNLQKWNDWFLPAIKAFQINTMELMSVIKRFLMWSSHMTMYISKLIILWKEKEECFSMRCPLFLMFSAPWTNTVKWNLHSALKPKQERHLSHVLFPPLPGTTYSRVTRAEIHLLGSETLACITSLRSRNPSHSSNSRWEPYMATCFQSQHSERHP